MCRSRAGATARPAAHPSRGPEMDLRAKAQGFVRPPRLGLFSIRTSAGETPGRPLIRPLTILDHRSWGADFAEHGRVRPTSIETARPTLGRMGLRKAVKSSRRRRQKAAPMLATCRTALASRPEMDKPTHVHVNMTGHDLFRLRVRTRSSCPRLGNSRYTCIDMPELPIHRIPSRRFTRGKRVARAAPSRKMRRINKPSKRVHLFCSGSVHAGQLWCANAGALSSMGGREDRAEGDEAWWGGGARQHCSR